jgi:hypothetical protein
MHAKPLVLMMRLPGAGCAAIRAFFCHLFVMAFSDMLEGSLCIPGPYFFPRFPQNLSLLVFILYSISINLTDSLPCSILVASKASKLRSSPLRSVSPPCRTGAPDDSCGHAIGPLVCWAAQEGDGGPFTQSEPDFGAITPESDGPICF